MNGQNNINYLYDAEKPEIFDFIVFRASRPYLYECLSSGKASPRNHKNRSFFIFWDAAGNKLCKLTMQDLAIEHTTDYLGNIVYVDDEIRYILTDEGRVVFNPDGSHEYQYFLKDHLGNTRVTFGEDGHIIQENSYYPFGMLERSENPATAGSMTGLSHQTGEDLPNKYLYNGKKLQDEFGLEWYDYGRRFYSPDLARFMGADSKTVGTAVNKITTGMGETGKNTVNSINKVAAGTGMVTKSTIKTVQQIKED